MKKFLSLVLLLFGCFLGADTIYLKNGNRLVGEVVAVDSHTLTLKMAFGQISLPKKNIRKIVPSSSLATTLQQAERLISLGATEHALRYLAKALPSSLAMAEQRLLAQIYLKAGRKLLEQRKFPLARKAFLLADKYHPQSIPPEDLKIIQHQQHQAEQLFSQGQKWQRQGKWQQALEVYQRAWQVYPPLGKKLQQHLVSAALAVASEHLQNKQYPQALTYYEIALEHSPEIFPQMERQWLVAKIQTVSQNYLQQQKWQQAIDELDEVLQISPDFPPALFLIGLCFERQREYQNAFFYYQQVTQREQSWSGSFSELKKARSAAQELLGIRTYEIERSAPAPQTPLSTKWQQSQTAHFEIFYRDSSLVSEVAKTLEFHWQEIYKRWISLQRPPPWPQHCQVYLHTTRQEYMQATGMPAWSDGVTQIRYGSGQLVSHAIHLYTDAPLLTTVIIPHELTHVMYPWFLEYQKALPLWMNEGIAMLHEPEFRQKSRQRSLQNALERGQAFLLQELISQQNYPQSEREVDIFYAQSYSLVTFLKKLGGTARFYQFSRNLQSDFEVSLRQYYRIANIEILERLWRKHVQDH